MNGKMDADQPTAMRTDTSDGEGYSHLRLRLASRIHFLFEKFVKPKSADEDEGRKEFILNIILCGSIVLLTVFDLFLVYDSLHEKLRYPGIHFIPFSLILLFAVFLLFLSRKGYSRLSSYLLVALYFIGSTYGMYRWGTGMQMALLTYVLIIVISSILVGTRFAFWITVALSTIIVVISHLQLMGIVTTDWYWKYEPERLHAEEFSFMFFLILTISWLSNREIGKSLARARKSEGDLKQERDQLEVTVEKRTADLKQAQLEKMSELYRFAEFGRLSSGLFHDLVNPLTGVALNVNALNESMDPKISETKRYLEKAVHATRRMEQFISTIQKQIGTQDTKKVFSPSEEICQAIELLEYKARKANVRIVFETDAAISFYGNALKFHRIAANLISNAIDSYANSNEHLNRKERVIAVELEKDSGEIILSVKDNGCGILQEILPKIFDPFFTTKSQHHGTGLGLSTTKTAVEKDFHGTITVESKQSEGSVFTVRLPFKNE